VGVQVGEGSLCLVVCLCSAPCSPLPPVACECPSSSPKAQCFPPTVPPQCPLFPRSRCSSLPHIFAHKQLVSGAQDPLGACCTPHCASQSCCLSACIRAGAGNKGSVRYLDSFQPSFSGSVVCMCTSMCVCVCCAHFTEAKLWREDGL
jgi:hypothetical protein